MKTYYGRYKGHDFVHRVKANSKEEAIAKMLKGTKYLYSEVIIKTKNPE